MAGQSSSASAANNKMILLDAEVNGQHATLLLDSDTPRTTVSPELADKIERALNYRASVAREFQRLTNTHPTDTPGSP